MTTPADAPTPPPTAPDLDAAGIEAAARAFHEDYEEVAAHFSYETRPESRVGWDFLPESRKLHMEHAAHAAITAYLTASPLLSTPAPDLDAIRARAAEGEWLYCDECNGIGSDKNVPFWCSACDGQGGKWLPDDDLLALLSALDEERRRGE